MKIITSGIFLAFLCYGCIQQIALNSVGSLMDTGFEVINEEQDLDLAEKSIASDLKLLETVIAKDPDNTHYLLLASMGYSSYALGFAEDDSIDRARLFYLRAKEYGMRILRKNKSFESALGKDIDQFRTALKTFSDEDLPAIYWTAVGWGSYVNLSITDPSAVADLPQIEEMIILVSQRDPTYYYGGPHFFLGTLYGSKPKMFGGNPELSRQHFEECLKINGGKFLMSYIFYAKSYAVQTQNKALFEQCLTTVDTTSIDTEPKARLANAIAKKKAKILRDKIDRLF
jgi:tetratricopeptide (TPR) repeat protein